MTDFVTIKETSIEGRGGPIRLRDYLPASAPFRTPVLWLHGGGFSSGGPDEKESDAPARVIAQSGRAVRTVDYRLAVRPAPWRKRDLASMRNPYPAGLHDVVDAAKDFSAAGRPYIIGEASAGACLAAAATWLPRRSSKC
ncbi:MAG TPA: alpha/beta hydrolase fold domain-containing protein [Humibacter sp.]|jgi:acetyl esterase/lipase|nr:alpha/beta hydrolase fold domain-containing protein [Humibacter sp.]